MSGEGRADYGPIGCTCSAWAFHDQHLATCPLSPVFRPTADQRQSPLLPSGPQQQDKP